MNLQLTDLIKEQGAQCLIMFAAGIALAVFYQICSLIVSRMQVNKWIRMGAEPIFWLAAAVLFSQFLYYCAHGQMSVHIIGAFGAGVLLWMKFFCGIIGRDNWKNVKVRGSEKKNGKKKKKQSV